MTKPRTDGETTVEAATRSDPNGIAFDRLVAECRPRLHRYCARMTGSVIDGEDLVQETLLKALQALPAIETHASPQAWLFRVAHNAVVDFLRRRARQADIFVDEDIDMIATVDATIPRREAAAASLRTFMRLPAAQRSAVILRDVLGHSVEEIGEVTGSSALSAKAALQRGRIRLRQLAGEPDEAAPAALDVEASARLRAYVDRFNARDFDGLRVMLADDVRLELVNKLTARGKRVGDYFARYAEADDWRGVPGFVDGRPAILMCDPQDPEGSPDYFILLGWTDDSVATIRDFRFARYAMDGARALRVG
jgi:RNA polymerase sigma-70 factor (ECF subfamily)